MFKIFKKIDRVHLLLGLLLCALLAMGAVPDGMPQFNSLFIGQTDDAPTVTPGDDDLYVAGTIEVDGVAYFDAAVDLGSTLEFGDVVYTLPSDEGTNTYVLTTDGSDPATLTWAAGGGATAYDDIGNSTGDDTIAHTGFYALWTFTNTADNNFEIENTGNLADAALLKLETKTGTPTDGRLLYATTATDSVDGFHYYNSDATLAAATVGLIIDYAESGSAHGDYILCRDNSAGDTVFSVSQDGDTVVGGTLGVTGAATFSSTLSFGALSLTGALTMGASGTSHDVIIHSDTGGDNITFHDAEVVAFLTDYEIQLDDGSVLNFGSGSGTGTGDATMYHNGTSLFLMPAANDDDFYIGSDSYAWNIMWEGDTNSSIVMLDSTNDLVSVDGVDVQLLDDDHIYFGNAPDFDLYSDGSHLYIAATADTASKALYIGDDTYDIDIIWEADTNAEVVTFDSDAGQVVYTAVDLVLNAAADFADDTAALLVNATGLGTTAGCAVRIDVDGSTPHAGAMALEIDGNAKDLIGIFADVDSTGDAYQLTCTGVTGALDAVLLVANDATMAATSSVIEAAFTGTDTNAPIMFLAEANSKNATGLHVDSRAVGATAWHIDLYSDSATVGPFIRSVFEDSDTADAADTVFVLQAIGDDAGADPHTYGLMEVESLLVTAGQEDGEFIFSVAANNGASTQALVIGPQLDSANTGISVGSGSATGAITAEGAYSLLLQTNYGTTSPTITIAQGAGADITLGMSTTGKTIIKSIDTGALGPTLTLQHDGGAEVDDDVVARIQFLGEDDAHADESLGRIDLVLRDETAATPDSDMMFYVDVAGTETLLLELGYTLNGAYVGSGAAAGYLSSAGSHELILQTGNATTGSITIDDAANTHITLAPNGSGDVNINLADVGAAATQSFVTYVARHAFVDTAPDGDEDIAIWTSTTPEMQIIDVWINVTTTDAGITAALRTGAASTGNSITSEISLAASGVIRTATLGSYDIAASGSLWLNFSADPDTADGELYIMYIRESQ